ncbi:unnamed protein product [Ambrosiozyma monospora]|uniref:Unnamed protein product n=1 Tax=Ambrosiozyma monospora TaxID=43982 RepID=A0ACB5UBE1_AMBMO|nr:unnamed protein product [Ambrosiozyma monospora]
MGIYPFNIDFSRLVLGQGDVHYNYQEFQTSSESILSKTCPSVFWYWVHGGRERITWDIDCEPRRTFVERRENGIVNVHFDDGDDDNSYSDPDSIPNGSELLYVQRKHCFDHVCHMLQESFGNYLHQVLSVNFECLMNLLSFNYDSTLGIQPNEQVVLKFLDMEWLEEFLKQNLNQKLADSYVKEWKDEMLNEAGVYKLIWRHNRKCKPDDFIHVPKYIYSGEINDDVEGDGEIRLS